VLPECKICWFCCHAKHEWRNNKRGKCNVYWCELGIKRIGAHRSENFRRCKGFEPNCEAIDDREDTLRRVIRECRTELAYLERLSVYAEHRRRRGAEYDRVFSNCFDPLFPETAVEGKGKTARACGFEEGETNESD